MDLASRELATYSPEEIQRHLAKAREAHETSKAELEALIAERERLLLLNDDARLNLIESKIGFTTRERDRHAAQIRQIEGYRDSYAEAHADAVKHYESIKAEVEAADRWLTNEYPRLAAKLAEGLARLQSAYETAEPVNRYRVPHGCATLTFSRHPPAVYREVVLPDHQRRHASFWPRR